MRILVFGVSTREGSYNRALAKATAGLLATVTDVTVDHADFSEFKSPLYDGDHFDGAKLPSGARELARRLGLADAAVIASPEFNGGISAILKNSIDWLSLLRPVPLRGKPLLLMSTSPGHFGGLRGLWHTRVPFDALGAHVFPDMLALPNAHQAFNDQGEFARTDDRKKVLELAEAFAAYVRTLKSV
jgi:chromate reductase